MSEWIFAFIFQAIFGGLMFLQGFLTCFTIYKVIKKDDSINITIV